MSSRRVVVLLAVTCALGCGRPLGRELFAPREPLRHADAIVVLGNRPPTDAEGRVAPETARRVAHGVALYRRGLAERIVMAGGPAPGGGTEADVMAAHAMSLGVPEAVILRERRSRDTAENARFTMALLCGEEDDDGCAPTLLVVSSPYHLRRALRLFRCAGARPIPAPTPIPDEVGYQASFTAYEYAVGIYRAFAPACQAPTEAGSY
ncbi:MAG: YdcF family protein [Sandaracinaceae bacterium]|nr:MAG: YdcF family protein [Sandaracinaceae bacterium]